MPWGAAAVVAGAAIGAYATSEASGEQADAAKQAADTQASANRYATDIQYKMFQEQNALQKPWLEAGQTALNKLVPLATNYEKFGMNQFQQDPGYAFRLAEGNKALNQSAAARGGLISGNALKAAQRYGQEMGSQEYGNAFNRYLREREAQLNPLQSLAGVGQTSAQSLGNAAGTYGANAGNLASATGASSANALMAAGQARASSYQGYGSAAGQALGGIGNYLRNYNSGGSNNLPDASGQYSVQGNSDYYYDL